MKNIAFILFSLLVLSAAGFSQNGGLYSEMMIFSNVLNHVRTNYVDETDPSELIGSTIYGLLTSLDPHTVYLDPQRFRQFNSIMSGEMYGIGIAFEIIDGKPTVISVMPGGPAEKARIRTGDIIIKINNQPLAVESEPEIQLLLGGSKETKITLTIKKYLSEEEKDLILERDAIPLHSLRHSYVLDLNTGYIKIDQFTQTTADELKKSLKSLKKQGMKNLILDLRGNPGGSLQSAVEVVDLFIPAKKVILSTKGRKSDASKTYYSSKNDKQPPYPMIVMIDRGSASASEIVAGALQEYDRALLVGTNSFGKGLVQGTFLLKNGGAILMTIARYYTPAGRLIQREYTGQNFAKYYSEIFDTDTSNYTERPELKTFGGRTIYGGGGIVPDVFVEPAEPVSRWEEIQDARILFKYANDYVRTNQLMLSEFDNVEEYAKSFSINPQTMDAFAEKLSQGGFELSESNAARTYLNSALKAEIAAAQWDQDAAHYVAMDQDAQLKKARECIPAINKFLEKNDE